MKIACAQISPRVGDFERNEQSILAAYAKAVAAGADLCLTPELAVSGYPPHDLVYRPEIFARNEQVLERLCLETKGQPTALAVGHISQNTDPNGRLARNTVTVFHNAKAVFTQHKTLLPTYDVFDEARYFQPAAERKIWEWEGLKIALGICEDFWAEDGELSRIYATDPVEDFAKFNPDLVISISSSPYEWGKGPRREKVHAQVATRLKAPLIYVNQVGATDEILFDGASFAVDAQGQSRGRLAIFAEDFGVVEFDLKNRTLGPLGGVAPQAFDSWTPEMPILHQALVCGIREYFARTGFKRAILGLSGGIDSAVVAVLASEALGPKNVLGVAMSSQYSSVQSLEDAQRLAQNLGIRFEVRPIKFVFSTLLRELSEGRSGGLAPVAQENLQARLRALTLMALANDEGALVLTTGNKSEIGQGYCTQYGDMAGALAPLGDIYKVRVYELARQLNTPKPLIPERILTKAPSAELRPNQTDQDTLPPYEFLDGVLEDYIDRNRPGAEVVAQHEPRWPAGGKGWVNRVLERFEQSEYKRKQAAPVLKVSPKAFGIGRRVPIAKVWTPR